MNKGLQSILLILIVFTVSCNVKDKIAKHKKAQTDADYIINNLDKKEVASHFPETVFPKEQTEKLLGDINMSCDWKSRKGNFVDYTTMNINGKNDVAFIYEYFLNCDSLRFILVYNIDEEIPKLFNFQMEPLEKKNPLVINTEKQLLK